MVGETCFDYKCVRLKTMYKFRKSENEGRAVVKKVLRFRVANNMTRHTKEKSERKCFSLTSKQESFANKLLTKIGTGEKIQGQKITQIYYIYTTFK